MPPTGLYSEALFNSGAPAQLQKNVSATIVSNFVISSYITTGVFNTADQSVVGVLLINRG